MPTLVLLVAVFASSAEAPMGEVRLEIVEASGAPAPFAEWELPELHRRGRGDAQGVARIAGVPAGEHLLRATDASHCTAVARVSVAPGAASDLRLVLDPALHGEEIVVSARAGQRGLEEVAQAISIVPREALARARSGSLGETLAGSSGTTSTGYAPGAGRPVLRGLSGDRVRILENGLGTGDVSATGPDHPVTADGAAADRVEIVRGPATLLHGGGAIGGVVNVLDGRLPSALPDARLTGALEGGFDSSAAAGSGSTLLEGALGPVAWHADAARRGGGDVRLPAGILPNSFAVSRSGNAGMSWVTGAGFAGIAAGVHDSRYGSPAEDGVLLSSERRRADARAVFSPHGPWLRTADLRAAATRYRHTEFENGLPVTVFTSESIEARLDAVHARAGRLSGEAGVHVQSRRLEAVGDEAFLPPAATRTGAIFAFEELDLGRYRLEGGARLERRDVSAPIPLRARRFDAASVAVGGVAALPAGFSAGAQLHRTSRAPDAEQLYADGPHPATFSFEVGDARLGRETATGGELVLRRQGESVWGEAALFWTRFDGFLYERPTGAAQDGLPVVRHVQEGAEFHGGETTLHVPLVHSDPAHVELELRGDWVRAEGRPERVPLTRIPPARAAARLRFDLEWLNVYAEAVHVRPQFRISAFETETASHSLLEAGATVHFHLAHASYVLLLRGTNLANVDARNHVSLLKDRVPLAGRALHATLRLEF